MSEQYNIGIDLGTTYSCLAFINDAGKPEVEKNFEQEDTTPSVILFNDVGEKIVGTPAKEMIQMYPSDKVVMDIKRHMGTDYSTIIDGIKHTPTTLSAIILSKLLKDFEDAHGLESGEITEATITVPADFGQEQREATINAGRIAGLEKVNILNEPTAAAISFGFGNNTDGPKKVLVYDLGGGTFDVTVLQIDGKNFSALATDGEKKLGGKDWDEQLKNIIIGKITEMSGLSAAEIQADHDVMEKLIIDSEDLKKRLSTSESTRGTMSIGGKKVIYNVTREEFEDATHHLVQGTIDKVDRTLSDAGIDISEIDSILLVGGSSRMPQVKNAMKEKYPDSDIKIYDPDQSVAKGAAVYSRSLRIIDKIVDQKEDETVTAIEISQKVDEAAMENEETIVVHNVLSKSFGVKVHDTSGNEYVSNIVFRNQRLPFVKSREYSPSVDGQRSIDVEIYEDSARNVDTEMRTPLNEATHVGQFSMKLPEAVTTDTPISIRFTVSNEGIIVAHVECLNEHQDYELVTKVSMSDEDIQKARGILDRGSE